MKQKIPIKLFATSFFEVALQDRAEAPARRPGSQHRTQCHCCRSVFRPAFIEGIRQAAVADKEMALADAVGDVTGDGMWVGHGGTSFLGAPSDHRDQLALLWS